MTGYYALVFPLSMVCLSLLLAAVSTAVWTLLGLAVTRLKRVQVRRIFIWSFCFGLLSAFSFALLYAKGDTCTTDDWNHYGKMAVCAFLLPLIGYGLVRLFARRPLAAAGPSIVSYLIGLTLVSALMLPVFHREVGSDYWCSVPADQRHNAIVSQ